MLYSVGAMNGERSAVLDYGVPYQSPDSNERTTPPHDDHQVELEDDEEETPSVPTVLSLQTPIHLAIVNGHEAVTQAFIDHKGKCIFHSSSDSRSDHRFEVLRSDTIDFMY